LQLQLKRPPANREASFSCLGIPATEAQPALQSDAYKELINKLAWAIGSSYDTPYNNTRTQTRATAIELASALIASHGYPRKIAFPN